MLPPVFGSSLVSRVERQWQDGLQVLCARCGGSVELVGSRYAFDQRRTIVVVRCHGEYAETYVDDSEIANGPVTRTVFERMEPVPLRLKRKIEVE